MEDSEEIGSKVVGPSGGNRSIRIRGLPSEVMDFQVHSVLAPFGPIKALRVVREKSSSSIRGDTSAPCTGEALATFEDEEDAADALDNLEGAEFLGKEIQVDFVLDSEVAAQSVDLQKPVWEQLDVVLPDA